MFRNRGGHRMGVGLLLAWLAWAQLGCGSSAGPSKTDGGQCTSNGTKSLNVVGNPNRVIHPGTSTALQVVLLEKCIGGVVGERVTFDLTTTTLDASITAEGGNPGNSSLAATSTGGIASVQLTAGGKVGNFQVRASHPQANDPVFFSITIKPVQRQLSRDGERELTVSANQAIDLKVKVTDVDSGDPVQGVALVFSIQDPNPGNGKLRSTSATTTLAGGATASFLTGSIDTTYTVLAQAAAGDLEKVDFLIHVSQAQTCGSGSSCPTGSHCLNGACVRDGDGTDCVGDDQCPEGYNCKQGVCRPSGYLPGSCELSSECPPGYFCENHQCYPCSDLAVDPKCKEQKPNCKIDSDCPPGYRCKDGMCIPDNPDNVKVPDVGGLWYSQHVFDISKALLGIGKMQKALDLLNKVINYCDITHIPAIDDILCKHLVGPYVPEWIKTLVNIFTNLSYILSELRAEGELELTHLNPRELLSATETWTRVSLRYLEACCFNRPTPCNPYKQTDFPACATLDIAREDLEVGKVGLELKPFTAKIQVNVDGANTRYTLVVSERKVQIQYRQFVSFVVDLLIQVFTGYDNLAKALDDLIDCSAIQAFVDDLWASTFGSWLGGNAPDIRPACKALKPSVANLIGALLDQIGVGWKALTFAGSATIAVEGDPPYGVRLGSANHETSKDGVWKGKVSIITTGDLAGSWTAER